mmetsp:Transcript_9583/g.26975  ORF Transcript_9583/g.26975 Transcript_9583/m.26975 type:complete len:284 (+) Transcript_9583:151-1002(+)
MEASLAEIVNSLLSIRWLEECLIISFIGLASIWVHRGLVAAKARKSLKPYKPCKVAPEEKVTVRQAPEPERSAAVRPTTPHTSADIPGVTDCRFVGQIISFRAQEGYGFISCPELYQRFHRDVFLHKYQMQAFVVGNVISFGVFLNKNGQPQAKDLEVPQDAAAGRFQCTALDPCTTRQTLNPYAEPFQPNSAEERPQTYESAPSTWEEHQETEKSWTTPCKSDRDSKGCYGMRWVPKVKAGDIASTWDEQYDTNKSWTASGKGTYDSKASYGLRWVPKVKAG